MPEDSQEVGAGQNDDDQLADAVDLDEQQRLQDGIRLVDIFFEVLFEFFVVNFVDYLLELLYIEQLSQSRQPQQLEKSQKSCFLHVLQEVGYWEARD